jgi:choline-sulfatase
MPRPANLVFILSDEHSAKAVGSYGHPIAHTPNIDRLGTSGVRFSSAYCNSPVCVPARAVIATGRYIHQMGFWDNADPYDGSVVSWHHRLRETGHPAVAIGKLHFRSTQEDNGFSEEIVPMHVFEGKGDLLGLVRDDLPVRGMSWKMAKLAGPGESPYTLYDRDITARAQTWLKEEARRYSDRPWVLFVSLVAPHFPLTAPPEHFYRFYDDPRLQMPKLYDRHVRPDHPYIRDYAGSFTYDEYFDSKDSLRRGVAGYLGLCSFVDENIGKMLNAIESAGLSETTGVIYTSDHGDNMGTRGLWGKSTMYEETVAVPFVMSGPDVPKGIVCDTPISHVDLYPTILDSAGVARAPQESDLPGTSLLDLATRPSFDRIAFSEYHGMGSTHPAYMVRYGRWKYVDYLDYPPQLFDVEADPEELKDLAFDHGHKGVLEDMRARLHAICDPREVDARARRRQKELLELHGGREAVIKRGDLGFTPPPGVAADFG